MLNGVTKSVLVLEEGLDVKGFVLQGVRVGYVDYWCHKWVWWCYRYREEYIRAIISGCYTETAGITSGYVGVTKIMLGVRESM